MSETLRGAVTRFLILALGASLLGFSGLVGNSGVARALAELTSWIR